MKLDIEETVGTEDEQVDESEEARLRQTVEVSVEAVEQVLKSFEFSFSIKGFRSSLSCCIKEGTGEEPQTPAPLTSGEKFPPLEIFKNCLQWEIPNIGNLRKLFSVNSHVLEIFKNFSQWERRGRDGQKRHHRKLDPG